MWKYTHYDELYHYGVKGMRWGVIRSKVKSARAKRTENDHEDYTRAHDSRKARTLSTQELKERNNRLQAEKQYASLTQKKNRGKAIVNGFIAGAATLTGVVGAYKVYKDQGMPIVKNIIDRMNGKAWL
jgi:hypothetical protein